MRRRLADERGFAVPLALAVILLILALGGVAIALATHNIDRSSRDRASVRALAAADAGLDAAAYRMAKMLLATEVDNLLSAETASAVLAEAGCLQVGVGPTFTATLLTSAACAPSEAEQIDASVNDDGLGPPASFRYWIKLGANVLVGGHSVLERQIVSVGEVDGVVRRAMGTYRFDLEAPLSALVTRTSWVECTATFPADGTDPTAGC